jgi:serine/threonine protein kinase
MSKIPEIVALLSIVAILCGGLRMPHKKCQKPERFKENHRVTFDEATLNLKEMKIDEGGYGFVRDLEVFFIQRNEQKTIAVKIPLEDYDSINREVEIYEEHIPKDSEYFLQYHGCVIVDNKPHLLMEKFGKSLSNLEKTPKSRSFIIGLFAKMVQAVANLHKLKIIHQDVKPDNFLYEYKDKKIDVKLIDFGGSAFGDKYIFGGTYGFEDFKKVQLESLKSKEKRENLFKSRKDHFKNDIRGLAVSFYDISRTYKRF